MAVIFEDNTKAYGMRIATIRNSKAPHRFHHANFLSRWYTHALLKNNDVFLCVHKIEEKKWSREETICELAGKSHSIWLVT